jgi:nucleoside-triphosphatase THEP1
MTFFKIHTEHLKAIAGTLEALIPPSVKDALKIIDSLGKLEPIAEGAVHAVEEVIHSNKHKEA